MKRIPELDSIRGLAAVTILLYHLVPNRFHLAWAGVDCFFVLSSYLITSILLEYRKRPGFFLNFYARRSLRIWPIYYLSLVGLIVANAVLGLGERLDGLPFYATYTQNITLYWGQESPPFIRAFDHTWTLALEEQYYILWPLLVYRCRRVTLVAISLALAVGSVVLRDAGMSGIILAGRCDGFALGGLLAVLVYERDQCPAFRARWAPLFAAILVTSAVVIGSVALGLGATPIRIEYFSVCFFGLIGLVVLRSGDWWLAPLRWAPLMYLGLISYGLYLYHIPIDRGVEVALRRIGIHHRLDVGYPLWRSALELALVITVATLSWHLIEQPILRLKSRFRYDVPDEPQAVMPASDNGDGSLLHGGPGVLPEADGNLRGGAECRGDASTGRSRNF